MTQAVVDSKLLMSLPHMLSKSDVVLIHSLCWLVSNIAAGIPEQIQSVLDTPIVARMMVFLTETTVSDRTKFEVVWTIKNILECGTIEHLHMLMDQCVVEGLAVGILGTNTALSLTILECLRSILRAGEGGELNLYARKMHDLYMVDRLNEFAVGVDQDLSNLAGELLDTYFSTVEFTN